MRAGPAAAVRQQQQRVAMVASWGCRLNASACVYMQCHPFSCEAVVCVCPLVCLEQQNGTRVCGVCVHQCGVHRLWRVSVMFCLLCCTEWLLGLLCGGEAISKLSKQPPQRTLAPSCLFACCTADPGCPLVLACLHAGAAEMLGRPPSPC
jgi:hypothetical protein